MQTNGFILRENQRIPYYSCRIFESLPWLRHGFSTRRGGTDDGTLNLGFTTWDIPERVNENRRRLLSALELEKAVPVYLEQIHSNHVYTVEPISSIHKPSLPLHVLPSSDQTVNRKLYEGDALVTNIQNVALTIKTADCFSVLIVDPVHRAIGAVHSGWRGTLGRVLPHAIEEMTRRFQSDAAQLQLALGPGIRECCFEVKEDVARLITEAYPEKSTARPSAPGKYLVDLAAVLKIQMTQSGVPLENQHDLEMCTCCNNREFFSWRADGATAGRMMTVIAIVPD